MSAVEISKRQKLLNEFKLVLNTIGHLQSDIKISETKNVYFNVDYNILYPWLWSLADEKDPYYDLIGRNIFTLYPMYRPAFSPTTHIVPGASFQLCFTVPSILELLDTLEHRHEKALALANIKSANEIADIRTAFKTVTSPDYKIDSESGMKVDRFLRSLPITNERSRLNNFLGQIKNGQIALLDQIFDRETLDLSANDIKADSAKILDSMRINRGITDHRRFEDKLFHYKVDSWNIASRIINQYTDTAEISYICRHTVREYYPGTTAQMYSRHPIVPMYQLYALYAAPPGSLVRPEAEDFIADAMRRISECIHYIDGHDQNDLSQATFYWKNKIDDTYNRFIRPLFFDYSVNINGMNMNDYVKTQGENRFKEYSSILTDAGFKDRFKQQADTLRDLVTAVVEVKPEITSPRLLEEYDLSNNPRVVEILRKFEL